MKTLALVGEVAAWLISVGAFLVVTSVVALSSSTFAPRNSAEWATVFGIYLSCLLSIIAINPLSWRLPAFNSLPRRLLFVTLGIAAAVLVSTFGVHAPRT